MSDVSSLSASSLFSVHRRHSRDLEQELFRKIDADGDNSISQAELQSAVTGAGGTTQGADALFAQLDTGKTGSVGSSQFISGFSALSFSAVNGQQLIDAQAQATGGSTPQTPFAQFTSQLFGKLDADGDGALTKSELEKAVTAAGGTAASADALYTQLDPDNTGSVSQSQFGANFPRPGQALASTASSDTAQAALGALFQSMNPLKQVATDLFSQLDADGDGKLTKSELEKAVTDKGGSAAQADVLYARLDPDNTGTVTEAQFTQYALANDRPPLLFQAQDGDEDADASTAAASSASTTSTAADQLEAAIQKLLGSVFGQGASAFGFPPPFGAGLSASSMTALLNAQGKSAAG